jgi:protein-disulfide isomerase
MSGSRDREERREQRLREETEVEAQARRKRLTQLVSAAVFLAIVAVAVVIVVSGSGGGNSSTIVEVGAVDSLLRGIPQHGTTLGEPQAKATLVEFGDLQCPVCKAYSEEVLPGVIEGQVAEGKAKLQFRNFTIISEQSVPAGAAAIAAGEQGRGWNFIELFYRNQGEERSGYVTDEFLTAIAKNAGVPDIARWNSERRSKRILAEVHKTTAEAESLGFEGTPSFAVEGPATSGLETLGTVEAGELEEAIANAGG